ncbi:ABC transporter substrate-binding protein [candidate division NPL-UPA2 bacterium]|nr:ABC transporter substrate-binding protein [candidate division NPL-UPA2 bacterium]
MKRKNILFIAISLIIVSGLLLLGRGRVGLDEESIVIDERELPSEVRIIVDGLGREVKVPKNPQRVIGLSRQYMEFLFALGVTPAATVHGFRMLPEGLNLPSIGSQGSPNIEILNKIAPDVIFANARHHTRMIDSLELSGAVVVFIDPAAIIENSIIDRLRFIGQVLGLDAEAEKHVQYINEVAAGLQEKIAGSNIETGILLMGGIGNIRAAQPTGFFGTILSSLGIENVIPLGLPGSEKTTFISFDIETIIKADPDIIIVRTTQEQRKNEVEGKAIIKSFENDPAWRNLQAVKNNRIIVLPGNIAPGDIEYEEALRITARLIYPDGFN